MSKKSATLAALLVGATLAAAACGGSDERAITPSVRTTADDRCVEETAPVENPPRAEKAEGSAAKITRLNPAQTEATGLKTAPPEGSSGPPDREAEEETSLARDAQAIAEQIGVDAEEALRRLRLQEDLSSSGLESELAANEQDTFAGLWIQHEPEYRFVVLFTRDGEETVRPYIEDEPWADVVEVRNGASATLAELKAEQAEASCIVDDLGIRADSSINVQENRVELNVTDRARFDAALREAGARLPEHVEVVEVEGLSEPAPGGPAATRKGPHPPGTPVDGPPPPLETDLGIVFPRRNAYAGPLPAVGHGGVLFVDERGCLRLGGPDGKGPGPGGSTQVPVWPHDYELVEDGVRRGLLVLGPAGNPVARVGNAATMSGKGVASPEEGYVDERQAGDLAERCPGPYWIVGNVSSDEFPPSKGQPPKGKK